MHGRILASILASVAVSQPPRDKTGPAASTTKFSSGINSMNVWTLPLNRPGAQAGGSLSAHLRDARRAAGPCLAALALIGTLPACGQDQTGDRGSDVDPLAEPAGGIAIRVAGGVENGRSSVRDAAHGSKVRRDVSVHEDTLDTSAPASRQAYFVFCYKEEGDSHPAGRRLHFEGIERGLYLSSVLEMRDEQIMPMLGRFSDWVKQRERFPDNSSERAWCPRALSREAAEAGREQWETLYSNLGGPVFTYDWESE
jgi:hypothetical protein